MIESCHWISTRQGRVFVPGCMGGAVYGPDRCTCRPAGPRVASVMDALALRAEEIQDLLATGQPTTWDAWRALYQRLWAATRIPVTPIDDPEADVEELLP